LRAAVTPGVVWITLSASRATSCHAEDPECWECAPVCLSTVITSLLGGPALDDPTAPAGEPLSLGSRALAYAAAGTPVFPCQPSGKSPITAHGFRDATTDPD
jgi:hypothetical protein